MDLTGHGKAEQTNQSAGTEKSAPALDGADHPLAMPSKETGVLNSEAASINAKLSAGDHTVNTPDGSRQFMLHVPENDGKTPLPVMFVISPSVNAPEGYDAKNFGAETGMSKEADQDKFIAVYPLPLKHLLGEFSKEEGFAWNAPGAGIHEADREFAGYDDIAYIKSITDMIPQLANVDSSHKNWGAIAFSQGGMFLNELQHEIPNLFPTLGLVGTTMETNHDYTSAPGNAHNVMIVNLRADKSTLPFPGIANGTFLYNLEKFKGAILPEPATMWIAEHLSALGGIDNRHQDPNLQMSMYAKELAAEGPVANAIKPLSTPASSTEKDKETVIKHQNSQNHDSLYIYDLPEAQHSYPGPDRGVRVNSTTKYNEFDTSAKFAKIFEAYNASLEK